jgi:hypothetical protein
MALYDLAEVNKASGQTTIMARVQNQAYQQAAQADLAVGANVLSNGQGSMAQVGTQVLDLSLLQGQKAIDGPITPGWAERYVDIDRTVEFGSKEYFALAEDPGVRPFLQSGSNVIFAYQGQVISIEDQEDQYERFDSPSSLNVPSTIGPDPGGHGHRSGTADISGALLANPGVRPAMALLSSLASLTAYTAAVLLIGLTVAAAIIYCFLMPHTR